MDKSYKKNNVLVGIFVFSGAMLILAGVLIIGNLNDTFNSKIELISHFEDVNGLQEGNNIWYSGVKVGNVNDIRFLGNSKVEVVMSVKKNIHKYIRTDSKVKIGSDGFIGNKILVIFGGTDYFPMVEKGGILESEKAVSTDDMLNTLQNNNENLLSITSEIKAITEQLSNGEGTLGKLIQDNSMYDNANLVLISLKENSATVQKLIASLHEFSLDLNKEGTLIKDLVTDTTLFKSIKSSVDNLQEITDTVSVLATNLKDATSNPNTVLGVILHDEQAGNNFKGTMRNLEGSSLKLSENLEALKHSFLFRGYFRRKEKEKQKQLNNK